MKNFKRLVTIFIISLTICFICKGCIYRKLVYYKSIGKRQTYLASNQKLIGYINENASDEKKIDAKQIIEIALNKTSRKLNFTFAKNNIRLLS